MVFYLAATAFNFKAIGGKNIWDRSRPVPKKLIIHSKKLTQTVSNT